MGGRAVPSIRPAAQEVTTTTHIVRINTSGSKNSHARNSEYTPRIKKKIVLLLFGVELV